MMFLGLLLLLGGGTVATRMATDTTRDDDGLLGPATDKEERDLGNGPEWAVPERTIDKFNV